MSRKYKFHNKEGLYFVTFAAVYWVDIMIREQYFNIIIDSMDYCRKNKGMEIYAYCIMPSHLHLVMRAKDGNPDKVLGRFKEFTSKALRKAIEGNFKESRRVWLMEMFKKAGRESSNVTDCQVWQHHNKPIELFSNYFIVQKVNYIHQNPVVSGFVNESYHWKYSSAIDYSGGKGVIEIDYLE